MAGSSPRIRGEYAAGWRGDCSRGIIPANTGRMTLITRSVRVSWDHPREYGENKVIKIPAGEWTGSSPRIRGESAQSPREQRLAGIIPANTGRMPASSPWNAAVRDHPREYGENVWLNPDRLLKQGSSPRIRGESTPLSRSQTCTGIIPANTGRINTSPIKMTFAGDHPREYGENGPGSEYRPAVVGSSPRIRGE